MHNRKTRVLIVEDDIQIRLLLCTILEQSGYAVWPAANGFAALEAIRVESPDVVLSDLHMPGMSGFELLPIIRQQSPTTRVVAMSSAFAGDDVPAGVAADAFYPKETEIDGLLQIIEAMACFDGSRCALPN